MGGGVIKLVGGIDGAFVGGGVVEVVGDNVDGDLVGRGVGKIVGPIVKGLLVGSGVTERMGEGVGGDVFREDEDVGSNVGLPVVGGGVKNKVGGREGLPEVGNGLCELGEVDGFCPPDVMQPQGLSTRLGSSAQSVASKTPFNPACCRSGHDIAG